MIPFIGMAKSLLRALDGAIEHRLPSAYIELFIKAVHAIEDSQRHK